MGAKLRMLVLGWLMLACAASCGARWSLRVPDPPPSGAFCQRADYRAGFHRLAMYLVLDRSGSMAADGKWDAATAALASFVADPSTAGLDFGLMMFPRDTVCDASNYDLPDVAIAPLPANGAAVTKALAQVKVDGGTPTRLALRSAIAYARSVMLGDPTTEVIVALLTDGAPNECGSDDDALAFAANQGLQAAPQVRTFVVGLATGYLQSLSVIARAGGTGAPILLGADGAAQSLIDTLREVRAEVEGCRYPVPAVDPAAEPHASDVRVTIESAGSDHALRRVASAAVCVADAFSVDDPPTRVTLCPSTCQTVRNKSGAQLHVTIGCGATSAPAPPGKDCSGVLTFACYADCSHKQGIEPSCQDGLWTCPNGTVPGSFCNECAPVPHGCCASGAGEKLAIASCIDGAWTCPPGAALFGTPPCSPPQQCAALMACPAQSYCAVGDFSCGEGAHYGTCQPVPPSCAKAQEVGACGCNGLVYPSACAARAAGIDVSIGKECAPAPSNFRCGPLYCNPATHACKHELSLGSASSAYACVPLPPGCTNCNCKLCNCAGCGESCQLDGAGQQITCTKP